MKAIFFALLVGVLLGGNLLATLPQEGGEEHEPTYCATNHKDTAHRCMCVEMDMGEGCKAGHRDVEFKGCLAFCAKNLCSCCAS